MECRTTNPTKKVNSKGEKEGKSGHKAERFTVCTVIEEAMSAHWKLAFRFACMTGLRQGEQRALTWGQVDLDNLKVHVTQAMKNMIVKIPTIKQELDFGLCHYTQS